MFRTLFAFVVPLEPVGAVPVVVDERAHLDPPLGRRGGRVSPEVARLLEREGLGWAVDVQRVPVTM